MQTPQNRMGAPDGDYAVLDRDFQASSNMWTIGQFYMWNMGGRLPWNVGSAAAAAAIEQLRPTEAAWMRPPDY